jgi:acetoin utilization protein AcuB
MSVKAIMTSPVVTVDMDDKNESIHRIFSETHFHHVLVVDNGKLHGIVSDRDLLKALSPNLGTAAEKASDLATLNKKVHQIMSRNPLCLGPEDSLHTVIEIFDENSISCIPIIDENRVPVGIVSWRDLFKILRKKNK